MTTTGVFESAYLKILSGLVTEAQNDLDQLTPKNAVEHRIKGHLQGLIAFAQGEFQKAREIMETTVLDHGQNINLIRDLTVCYYHLNDMVKCRQYQDLMERILVENESLLNVRSLMECETMLGKFHEEEGRLAPAMIFYERALQRCERPDHRLRVLIQKARWMALYEVSAELSVLYRELISYPTENLTRDLLIELEHSLSLIELRLIGADHAWERIERLAPNLPSIDHRLMVFDFIEGALSQELVIPQPVLEIIELFQDLDPFEKFLKKILKESLEQNAKLHELSQISSKLPWASYLRLLCLCANLETHPPSRMELNRKIQLIIRSLDPKSQALWNLRLRQAIENPEIRLEFSPRLRTVAIQGKGVDLSKKKIGLQLLTAMIDRSTLTIDEAIQTLWQSTFTPEHYHRLRMGVHRLNTLIFEATGLGKVIEVDSQQVRLRPEVRLVNSDHRVSPDFISP